MCRNTRPCFNDLCRYTFWLLIQHKTSEWSKAAVVARSGGDITVRDGGSLPHIIQQIQRAAAVILATRPTRSAWLCLPRAAQ